MSCERFDRDDYEVRVADYIRGVLPLHEGVDVSVGHTSDGWIEFPTDNGDRKREEVFSLEVVVGYADGVPWPGPEACLAELAEKRQLDDERTLETWQLPGGEVALVIQGLPQRPELIGPLFSVALGDWPLERSPETDLGPRFTEALKLLTEACIEARKRSWREWREQNESPKGATGPTRTTPEPKTPDEEEIL
jgi:hypothetical protein